jgi:hypothetical protein
VAESRGYDYEILVRFQVITAPSMQMTVLCDIAPCSLVEVTDVSEVVSSLPDEAVALYKRWAISMILHRADADPMSISILWNRRIFCLVSASELLALDLHASCSKLFR